MIPLKPLAVFALLAQLFATTAAYSPAAAVHARDLGADVDPPATKALILGAQSKCKKVYKRKEWRALTTAEKLAFINALKCAQARPKLRSTNPAVQTIWDEFQDLHIAKAIPYGHNTGQFLPWHRGMLHLFEKTLREECNYQGPMAYWDWTIDADKPNVSFKDSPVFDVVTGIGGDGVPGTYTLPPDPTNIIDFHNVYQGCVQTGPFASLQLHVGPATFNQNHCIVRQINDSYKQYLNSTAIAAVLAHPNYEVFRIELEGQPVTSGPRCHDGFHLTIGGEMTNTYSSPGDPAFYLHHTQLDRLWWIWQKKDLPNRVKDISGPVQALMFVPDSPQVTLDTVMSFHTFAPGKKIRDVMNIGSLCYEYV